MNQTLLFPGDYPDPSILRVGDGYYVTHSCFNWSPGLLIWHSRDLSHWTPLVFALPDYFGDIWAPELICHGGRFYLYFFCAAPHWGNFVITADRIEGPWSAPTKLEVGWIDPGHAVGPDGKRYLHVSDGNVVEIDPSGTKVISAPSKSYHGWPIPPEWRVEGFCLEGPKVLQRNGWYYMIAAQGGTAGPATAHMVVVARSRTPVGPWENSPHNPLVHTPSREAPWHCLGHGTIFEGPGGQWSVIYHGYRKGYVSLGRQTLLAPVAWTSDNWPILSPAHTHQPALAPVDLSDDFSSPNLRWQWRFWGEHDRTRYTLADGALTLRAKGASIPSTSPLSTIAGHEAYSVSVRIRRLAPTASGALLLYYSDKAYVGWNFGPKGAGACSMAGDPYSRVEPDAEELEFKLVNDHHELDFLYRKPGGQWIDLKASREISGFHHNTFGGFLSLRPALCAFGEGQVQFRDFRLEPLR